MTAKYHVELKLRNAGLLQALADRFPPEDPRQKFANFRRAADEIGIQYYLLLRYLGCGLSPYRKKGSGNTLSVSAEKICMFLDRDAEELFPKKLYERLIERTIQGTVDADRIISLAEARSQRLLPASAIDLEKNVLLEEAMDKAVKTLSPREEEVIRRLYGLGGNRPESRGEIALSWNCTRTNVNRYWNRALRKLRHPTRRNLHSPDRGACALCGVVPQELMHLVKVTKTRSFYICESSSCRIKAAKIIWNARRDARLFKRWGSGKNS